MECVQQTIASAELNGIIELPLALRNRKVQVIVLPAEDTETEQLRPQKRQLGFLKDKVPPLPDSFFDPLPEEDLKAWGL